MSEVCVLKYEEKLVYETEGERGLAERGYFGEAAREAEIERQRWEAEYQQAQEDAFHANEI